MPPALAWVMTAQRKAAKRLYRRYVRRCMGYNPGLIDRNHARYMGYVVPMSLREWLAAGSPV